MYLSIIRPSRRAMLKQALTHFLTVTDSAYAGVEPEEARKLRATMGEEARLMLREVQASENLMLAHPTTNEQEPT